MSNLLKALAMPPFGYFAPWESKKPDDPSSASVPEQPDQLKVQFSVVAAGARTPKDLMAYVVPDQATHVEFFLHYTHTQFMQNIVGRLDETNRTNGKYLFELLPKCLQGAAVMAWKTVVDRFIFADADSPTADEFNEVVQHYLEEVAGLKYLKDAALRFLLNSKKPMEMSPLHFFPSSLDHHGLRRRGIAPRQLRHPHASAAQRSRVPRLLEELARALRRDP